MKFKSSIKNIAKILLQYFSSFLAFANLCAFAPLWQKIMATKTQRRQEIQRALFICLILILPALTIINSAFAQQQAMLEYGKTITASDLKKHLSILASDEYEGRETGKEGQKKAAKYLALEFEKLGFPKVTEQGYFQEFALSQRSWGELKVNVNQQDYKFLKDFYCYPDINQSKIINSDIEFIGYGITSDNYNDYAEKDVKAKVLMILSGEPVNKKGISAVSKTSELSEWSKNVKKKIDLAKENKAKALIIVDNDFDKNVAKYGHYLESPKLKLKEDEKTGTDFPVIFISKSVADSMLKPNKKQVDKLISKIGNSAQSSSFTVNSLLNLSIGRLKSKVITENVLGYLKGSDLSEELIVISAHYDHIGVIDGEVYNGADDDGSGTSAILELAEAFSKAKKENKGPRRSILFLAVTGEEKGLLGSDFYTSNPVFPLANTVANLNIDMIGRVDEAHKDAPNYVYVIGSDKLSTQLHKINEEANNYAKLKLDYTYNDPKDPNRFYYRSDHYNFAKNNIPIIFYFNGVHEDYHQKTDEIDKINFELMAERSKLVFYTAWELVNRDQRIKVDVKNDFPSK